MQADAKKAAAHTRLEGGGQEDNVSDGVKWLRWRRIQNWTGGHHEGS
jgi:hypothetical protein